MTSSNDSHLHRQIKTGIFISSRRLLKVTNDCKVKLGLLADTVTSTASRRDRVYDDQVTRSCEAHAGGLQSYDFALTWHDRDIWASRCDVATSSSPAATETLSHIIIIIIIIINVWYQAYNELDQPGKAKVHPTLLATYISNLKVICTLYSRKYTRSTSMHLFLLSFQYQIFYSRLSWHSWVHVKYFLTDNLIDCYLAIIYISFQPFIHTFTALDKFIMHRNICLQEKRKVIGSDLKVFSCDFISHKINLLSPDNRQ